MDKTIKNLSLFLNDYTGDLKSLGILGKLLSPVFMIILFIIFLLGGVIVFLTLLDLLCKLFWDMIKETCKSLS